MSVAVVTNDEVKTAVHATNKPNIRFTVLLFDALADAEGLRVCLDLRHVKSFKSGIEGNSNWSVTKSSSGDSNAFELISRLRDEASSDSVILLESSSETLDCSVMASSETVMSFCPASSETFDLSATQDSGAWPLRRIDESEAPSSAIETGLEVI